MNAANSSDGESLENLIHEFKNVIRLNPDVSEEHKSAIRSHMYKNLHLFLEGETSRQTIGVENIFCFWLDKRDQRFWQLDSQKPGAKQPRRKVPWKDTRIADAYLQLIGSFEDLSDYAEGESVLANGEKYGNVSTQFRVYTVLKVADLAHLRFDLNNWGSTNFFRTIMNYQTAKHTLTTIDKRLHGLDIMDSTTRPRNEKCWGNYYTLFTNGPKLLNAKHHELITIKQPEEWTGTMLQDVLGQYNLFLIDVFETIRSSSLIKVISEQALNRKGEPFIKRYYSVSGKEDIEAAQALFRNYVTHIYNSRKPLKFSEFTSQFKFIKENGKTLD